MFRECHELVEVNFNEIENKEVENMEEMFYQCESLKKVNFGKNFTKSAPLWNKKIY